MRIHHALVAVAIATALPAQLNGPYTVGPGGSFANLTAAINALNAQGVAGPVSFLVTANDTGPWTISGFTGQGAANPVLFDGQGTVAISGAQPVLTLSGCANVTISGFTGSFTAAPPSIVVNAGTTSCVFTRCDFRCSATPTSGTPLINLVGGSGIRIEDSTFGGGYEALVSQAGNDTSTVQRCNIVSGGGRIVSAIGTNFTLVNNFITGNANYGIHGGGTSLNSGGANFKCRNNTVFIMHTATAASQYCTLRWYSNAAGTEVVNNIFYDWFPTTGNFNMWCSGVLRPAVMNNNCFWSNQSAYFPVYASGNQTLAQWQALGFDLNSIQADPLLVAPMATPADLRLQNGSPCATAAQTIPSVLTDFFQSLRSAPYSIGAHEEVGGLGAFYAVFGAGCAGSAGVPTNTAAPTPALGTTSVITFGSLPAVNVVIMVTGFSNTASVLGPLPFHLALFGAPGCSARVSLDATAFLVGTGGSASYSLSVPNQPLLTGMQVFTQGLALDPGRNAMGAVTSDAATARVGL